MASTILPVAKSVYVCDDVVADSESGKVSVLNLFDSVLVPRKTGFPHRLEKLCTFVWFRGGFGILGTRVEVLRASDGMIIHRTEEFSIRFPSRTISVYARYMIQRLSFPTPGKYIVEVYCEGRFVDDQVFRLREE